jgi:hypothetical protein
MKALLPLVKLEHLDLSNSKVSGKLRHLAHLANLRVLKLVKTGVRGKVRVDN